MYVSDLKMAAARNDESLDFDPRSSRSGVNIQFVDEDELPLAHVTEHRVAEDEFYSDESESSQEDTDEPTSEEDTDEEIKWMRMWRKTTGLRRSIAGKM